MNKAQYINKCLGVEIYKTDSDSLILNQFTVKQVKDLLINDLINCHGKATKRLEKYTKELLESYEQLKKLQNEIN